MANELMPKESREILAPTGEPTVAQLFQIAIQSGLDADSMTKIADLYERMEAKKAEQAYTDAIRAFQAECPPIRKTQDVQGRYQFAPFDQVVRVIKPYLAKHGLSFKHDTPAVPKDGFLVVEVAISHAAGHHETSSFPVEVGEGTKMMSKAQVVSAAISFGRRNALISALGLVTSNEDDDAVGLGSKLVSEDQIATLEALIEEVKADRARFLQYLGVDSLDKLSKRGYGKAVRALQQKRAAR